MIPAFSLFFSLSLYLKDPKFFSQIVSVAEITQTAIGLFAVFCAVNRFRPLSPDLFHFSLTGDPPPYDDAQQRKETSSEGVGGADGARHSAE